MDKYQITVGTFDKLAQKYQDKYMHMDFYHDTYDTFCDFVTRQNANIFEIGCGPGNITRYLLNKRPDFNILATDISPKMVTFAKNNNPEAECFVLDSREINKVKYGIAIKPFYTGLAEYNAWGIAGDIGIVFHFLENIE